MTDASVNRVAELARAISEAFDAYTADPTPYNEGILDGLKRAASIISDEQEDARDD